MTVEEVSPRGPPSCGSKAAGIRDARMLHLSGPPSLLRIRTLQPRGDIRVPGLLAVRLTAIARLFVVAHLFGGLRFDEPVGERGEILVAPQARLVESSEELPHFSRVDFREVEVRLLVL